MTLWDGRGVFEVSSADPDSTSPVWVDLTLYIRDAVVAPRLTIGRQNDLDRPEPSRLELLLDNADDRFTFGNTASPYAAWWGPGRKCRYREVVAGVPIALFVGYIQVPTEGLVTSGIEQRVAVTAVDRLGRLESGEPFSSALGEYILDTTDLVGYWPLTDAAAPYRGIGPTTASVELDSFVVAGQQGSTDQALAQQGTAPPGGEASGLRLVTGKNEDDEVTSYCQLSWPLTFAPAVGNTESVTVVMWAAVTGTTYVSQMIASILLFGTGSITITLSRDLATGSWTLDAGGAMTGSVVGGAPGDGALFPIGIRYTMSPANMELWIGGQRFTTTPTGVAPTGVTLFQGNFASLPIDIDPSHMQVYIGSTYSYADFQAQITQGYSPLERQTTGDRIRTIARYAGVPASELTRIDPGQSVMQAATLAGRDPLTAMRDAERTEQGLLYVDGDGQLVFKDRRTLYNI